MIIIIAFWVLCGILGYLIGQAKGRGEEGAVAGLLLGPLGLLFMLGAKDKRRRCPHCREPIAAEATVCPHCQREVAQPGNAVCQHCNHTFQVTDATLGHVARCPHCKKMTLAKKAA